MNKPSVAVLTFIAAVLLLLLGGCSGEPDTGPAKIRWDREVCARCVMAVSDPRYAAQIRGGPGSEKTRVYKFDDIGCAVIWLDEQPWKNDPRTEIWVADFRNQKWIDATKAWYISGKKTPMDYGLGAQNEPAEGALDFAGARRHIEKVDQQLYRASSSHEHHPVTTEGARGQ